MTRSAQVKRFRSLLAANGLPVFDPSPELDLDDAIARLESDLADRRRFKPRRPRKGTMSGRWMKRVYGK